MTTTTINTIDNETKYFILDVALTFGIYTLPKKQIALAHKHANESENYYEGLKTFFYNLISFHPWFKKCS